MANQRKAGIVRVTVTLPSAMLSDVESLAAAMGKDRLTLIRDAIVKYLALRASAKSAMPPMKRSRNTGE